MKKLFILFFSSLILISCSEHYSKGERVGTISKFSQSGLIWKSWEGELHVTQTGMNSTMNEFDFSIDNDQEEPTAYIKTLDSAAKLGWKVRISYHECKMKNKSGSRGDTDFFLDSLQVIDRNFNSIFSNKDQSVCTGKIIDTIYVVIDKNKH